MDAIGNVFVTGALSNNAFRIATPRTCSTDPADTPCTIREIIDVGGDGEGNFLSFAYGITVGPRRHIYVTGYNSDNAFRIHRGRVSHSGDRIEAVITAAGDELGNFLQGPAGIAVDLDGQIFVSGAISYNVFEILPPLVPSLNFLGIARVCSLLGILGSRELRARPAKPQRSETRSSS